MGPMINNSMDRQTAKRRAYTQRGYTLIISVVFSIGFAAILGLVLTAQKQNDYERKVYAIAWQLQEIGKAARLYVRNNSLSQHLIDTNGDFIPDTAAALASTTNLGGGVEDGVIDNLYERTALAAMGVAEREFTVDDLINAGYLPANFGLTNAAGEHITSLRQRIRIFADLSPIGGAVTPDNTTTVSTAYIILEDSPQATAQDIILITQALQNLGTSVSAPLFNGATNISDNCDGAPAVAIWDTGCLNNNDFLTIMGLSPDPATDFANGDLIIPAWKTAPHDQRSLMRFPQPENFGYATMLTDLYMGACSSDPLMINTAGDGTTTIPEEIDSGVCRSISDDPTLNLDNRRAIFNIASLSAQRMIASDQRDRASAGLSVQDVQLLQDGINAAGTYSEGETAFVTDPLDIDGGGSNLNVDDVIVFNSMDITGDVQIYDDTDFDYAQENNFSRGYHGGNAITVAERVFLSNPSPAAVDLADAVVTGTLDAPNMDLRTDVFNADDAGLVTTVGIDSDTQNPPGINTNDLNTQIVNIQNDVVIESNLLDGPAGSVGLTANRFNANGSDFETPNADFLGTVGTGSMVVTGTNITNPALSAASNIGTMSLSSGVGVSTGSMTVEGVLSNSGVTNLTGVTNIELCTGDCPDLLDDPGPLFP